MKKKGKIISLYAQIRCFTIFSGAQSSILRTFFNLIMLQHIQPNRNRWTLNVTFVHFQYVFSLVLWVCLKVYWKALKPWESKKKLFSGKKKKTKNVWNTKKRARKNSSVLLLSKFVHNVIYSIVNRILAHCQKSECLMMKGYWL